MSATTTLAGSTAKVTGLTYHNVQALNEVAELMTTLDGTTKSTATFTDPRFAAHELTEVIAGLPKGSTRHSLHAVLRKVRVAAEQAQAEDWDQAAADVEADQQQNEPTTDEPAADDEAEDWSGMTKSTAVLAALVELGEPVKADRVAATLAAHGRDADKNITQAMSALQKAGKATNVGGGLWAAGEGVEVDAETTRKAGKAKVAPVNHPGVPRDAERADRYVDSDGHCLLPHHAAWSVEKFGKARDYDTCPFDHSDPRAALRAAAAEAAYEGEV